MAKRSLCSRIIQVAQGLQTKTNKNSVLPNPDISEVADAIKFLVYYKWPASLSLDRASHTLCTMLPQTHSQASPSIKWVGAKEQLMYNSPENGGKKWDWQRDRSETRRRWRESGVTPRELLRLVQMMKERGINPNRDEYSRLLQACTSICEREGSAEAGLHSAVREIVRRIKEDLGPVTAGSVVMSSILPVASSQAQAKRIRKNLVEVPGGKSKESSLQLLEAYLSVDEDSKAAVSTIMTQLAPNLVPLSAHTLERVLLLCIKNYKLSQAVGTYSCMTRRYGIAPSKEVYTKFTSLLSATSDSHYLSESLCYRILTDTKAVFGGSPPLWVYTQMSKPLLRLIGLQGYRDMYQLSARAALEYSKVYGGDTMALMRQSWEPSLYHSLINDSSHFLKDSTTMALHLYREMVAQGGSSTERTFELLLSLAHKREHLSSYITPLLFEMKSLSKEHIVELREPLVKALGRIYDYHTVGLTHSRKNGWYSISDQDTPEFISLAGQLLVYDTLPLADSHQHCLDQLASLNDQHRYNTSNCHVGTSVGVANSSDHQKQVSVSIG